MATKKAPAPKPKPKAAPSRLENLAARQPSFDDAIDEQLVDHSGVFRVTTDIAKDQIGHGDDSSPRFPNESLVMAAQRGSTFGDEGPTIDESIEIEDETTTAAKRQRLATLAARAQRPPPPRKR
ncbi:MAG: hypothetical protein H0T42_03050 [Deltaproteobacteria bacterium]|nr:hypothetical protein [Deltaproteobacteria bacterium]